jgi:CMP-N-acetylneuraminic acid synthetase
LKLFIPIKKNSQRVVAKNFRKVNGIPLYKYVLYKLKDFEVYVDTDSEEIIHESSYDKGLSHVVAYKREDGLVGDNVSVCELIFSFINRFSIRDDELICQIHVTSPFIRPETLRLAAEKIKLNYDSVVSCNVLQTRLWRSEEYGYCPINHNPLVLEQTQDLPKFFEENSLFYIFQAFLIKNNKIRIGKQPFFYETHHPENIDIDTEDDWSFFMSLIDNR